MIPGLWDQAPYRALCQAGNLLKILSLPLPLSSTPLSKKEGRKEGRKEGKKEGRKEGKKQAGWVKIKHNFMKLAHSLAHNRSSINGSC